MIRKKYFKNLSIILALFCISSVYTGCSYNENNYKTSNIDSEKSLANTTILGRVMDIDGSKIKIALGTEQSLSDSDTIENSAETENKKPSSDSGEKIEKPDEVKGEPKEKPDGENGAPKEKPDNKQGEKHDGNIKNANIFTLTGEEKTIEISNDSLIKATKGSITIDGTLDDIVIGEIISVEYDKSGKISSITVNSNNSSYSGGSQTGNIALAGDYTADGESKSFSGEKFTCESQDKSAIVALNSGKIDISDAVINKTGNTTSNDESNFYGINSAVTSGKGGNIVIKDSSINTDSEGSNAIFATGDGSIINVSNVTINTSQNSSRGLDATYNGTIVAENVNITTKGAHCASLATDRGEGTVHVNGGTMHTYGEGSPGIYSTGNISAKNANFTAEVSQAAVIEGKNSITITDCNLVGYKNNGVMLYQSFSGDSGIGTCYFNMNGGSIKAIEGPMFYITNTDAVINLKNAQLTNDSGILINSAIGRWGKEGSNGGKVTLNASNQTLNGDINCDSISKVDLNLKDNSTLTGKINSDNTGKYSSINLDEKSEWNVTGISYINALVDEDEDLSNIIDNGNTIYYDSNDINNAWLDGKTITLSGGGSLTPKIK